MRTIKTNYGHLATESTYQIGIRTRKVKGIPHYYGHVHFPTKGTHKQTRLTTNQEGVKTFITAVVKHSKDHDFSFKDQDGVIQWFDFDPTAPSFNG